MSDTCSYCKGEIHFRWINGVIVPIHEDGGCAGGVLVPEADPIRPAIDPISADIRARWGLGHASTHLGEPLTYPTTCPYCGAQIFFHTNGNGDVVFFDALGPPWPKHPCLVSDVRLSEGSRAAWDDMLRIASLQGRPKRIVVPKKNMTLILGWGELAETIVGQTLRGVVVRTEAPRIAYREAPSGFGRSQCRLQEADLFVGPGTIVCLGNVGLLLLEVGQVVEVQLSLQWFESRRLLVVENPAVVEGPCE